ncbi:histidinol dehydrogenase [Niabella ginsengisoli]|uniref:Histidinol dehydrogenase n=1 Tax=Niabella ginsengisoli TaxID=522298 RepID=A0ABS9SHF4_9BACT|nr:histidinol dehydrogenase [Niabella ginsengisoli]MCH5597765.1 histidinol dehydrogenase [Niabella ginsengisoli]
MNLKIYKYPSTKSWGTISQRPLQNSNAIQASVNAIIYDVANNGDVALKNYASKFDGVALKALQVSSKEITAATKNAEPQLKKPYFRLRKIFKNFIQRKSRQL